MTIYDHVMTLTIVPEILIPQLYCTLMSKMDYSLEFELLGK
jgi:hypothetical protein